MFLSPAKCGGVADLLIISCSIKKTIVAGAEAGRASVRPPLRFRSRPGSFPAGIHRRARPTDTRRHVNIRWILFFSLCHFGYHQLISAVPYRSLQDRHRAHRPVWIRRIRVRQSAADVAGRLRLEDFWLVYLGAHVPASASDKKSPCENAFNQHVSRKLMAASNPVRFVLPMAQRRRGL